MPTFLYRLNERGRENYAETPHMWCGAPHFSASLARTENEDIFSCCAPRLFRCATDPFEYLKILTNFEITF